MQLDSLFEKEYYFKLKNDFQKNEELLLKKHRLYYGGLIDNAFYNHFNSNEKLHRLLNRKNIKLTSKQLHHVRKALFMNYYNLFEYELALRNCSILIADYQGQMDSAAYENLFNDKIILSALQNTPPQKINKYGDSKVGLFKDKMGLVNMNVQIGNDSIDFLFDTGSSFSFIKRSIAEHAGLQIYDTDFEVEGATGAVVICDIAVVDSMFFGNLEIEHSVFWVFDDKDLTLPEYDYSVNGAIAFPVLKTLEEVHLFKDTMLFIPKTPNKYDLENLAINDLDPIISVKLENDTLPFYFDTGSAFSSFYKPFYDMHAPCIDTTYEKKTFTIGSIGGVKEFNCFIIDSIEIEVAGKPAVIQNVETHTEPIYKDAEKVFGNLGQDYIYQFNKMIISTKDASVVFE